MWCVRFVWSEKYSSKVGTLVKIVVWFYLRYVKSMQNSWFVLVAWFVMGSQIMRGF